MQPTDDLYCSLIVQQLLEKFTFSSYFILASLNRFVSLSVFIAIVIRVLFRA